MAEKTPLSGLPKTFDIKLGERHFTLNLKQGPSSQLGSSFVPASMGGCEPSWGYALQTNGSLDAIRSSACEKGVQVTTAVFEGFNCGHFLVEASVNAFGQKITSPMILALNSRGLFYVYHNVDPQKTQAEFIRLSNS